MRVTEARRRRGVRAAQYAQGAVAFRDRDAPASLLFPRLFTVKMSENKLSEGQSLPLAVVR